MIRFARLSAFLAFIAGPLAAQEDTARFGKAADRDVGVGLVLAVADRHVDVVVDDVQVAVGGFYVHGDVGVTLGVVTQQRCHVLQ